MGGTLSALGKLVTHHLMQQVLFDLHTENSVRQLHLTNDFPLRIIDIG
jgi:hypothetical protein